MTQPISFDDLIPAKGKSTLPQSAPALPLFKVRGPDGTIMPINAPDGQTALRMAQQQYAARQNQGGGLFGDKTAPGGFGGMVARSIGAQDPAYRQAYDEMQRNYAFGQKYGAGETALDHVTDAFQPYANGALAYLMQGGQNLVRSATGQPVQVPASTAYQATADATRAHNQQWAQAHPAQSAMAKVLGMTLAGPRLGPGFLPKAAPAASTLLGRAANAAKSVGMGAGLGGAYGAAEAPDGHHVFGAVAGGLTGAFTTGALMGAGKLAKAVGGPVLNMASNRLGAQVTGASVPKAPARQALSYVANKLWQARVTDLAGSSAPTAAEAGGNTTRTALAALARQSGQTPEAVQSALMERRAGRPDRILDAVAQATGIDPSGAKGSVDAIIAKGRQDASPLFDAVRATPGPVWNADLAEISQRPAMKAALKATAEAMQNAGKDPYKVGLAIDPDTGGFKVGPDLGSVTEPQPTAEAWENVRQMLGDLGKEMPNMSNTQRIQARGFQAAQRDLTSALAGDENGEGALIPGYRDALNVAGDYKSAEGAFNGARGKLFSQKFTPADLSDMMDGMSPGEQNAVRHALASDLYDSAQNGLLTLNRVKSPAVRAKLTLAFGPDAAGQIGDTLANEANMQAAEQQILPQAGSQTAPLSAEIKAQQDNPLGDFMGDAISHTVSAGGNPIHGFGMAALKSGMKGLGSALKTPGMGTAARDEAGRLLLMTPQDLAVHFQTNAVPGAPVAPPTISPQIGGLLSGALTNAIMPKSQDEELQPATY